MKENGINVLSLFDGISCAKLALERAGIKVKNYYSSEIDKSALAVQSYHYSSDTSFHQIGDVKNIDGIKYAQEIDLVIFGSPCTQLSSVNSKDRSGLEGPDSSLFYEAIRIMKEIVANNNGRKLYFLKENVASMSNRNRNLIHQALSEIFPDVQMIKIDSATVAASRRCRYYWSNIANLTQPEPTGIKYQDILVNGYTDKKDSANTLLSTNVTLTNGINRYYLRNIGNIVFKDKAFACLSKEEKLLSYPFILNKSGYKGVSRAITDEYVFPNGCYRLPSVLESERLMTIPDNYINSVRGISKTVKHKLIGLSFTVDVVAHLLKPLKHVSFKSES